VAAGACGYEFRSLDGDDGYLFEVSDGARRVAFAAGAGSPYALNDARAASIARDKVFCAEVLRQVGIAVVPGQQFFCTERWREMRGPGREPADALAYAARAAYPLFCKPISASSGMYAEVIGDLAQFGSYLKRVSRDHYAIVVQPYIRAPEYRVLVLNGAPLFSYRKRLPSIVGDGRTSVQALLGSYAVAAERAVEGLAARNAQGAVMAVDYVAAPGEQLAIEGPANRAAGGGAEALQDGAPDRLSAIALAAADALGLKLAAVDIFDAADGPLVIEVNSNPMLATLEDHDRWDLIVAIWRANLDAALK
jgi:glutathione synthase/RimK-type ligase-like ATP-grasp enzyme